MAFSIIGSTSAGSVASGPVTTPAIDTTLATLIVIAISNIIGLTGAPTDSLSNTWTALTAPGGDPGLVRYGLYMCASPIVGAAHTFTHSEQYPALAVVAVSGAHASPLDQESTASFNPASSSATGSVTPSENDELLVTGLSVNATAANPSIDGDFTILESVNAVGDANLGIHMAYLIQTTAASANPTWSWTGSSYGATSIATFKASAGGGGIVRQMMQHHHHRRPRKDPAFRRHESGLYLRAA